jgi:hypothetical protein
MSIFTKRSETRAEIAVAVAELETLKQQQEEQERTQQERRKAIKAATAEIEKQLPGRTRAILDAYHQRLAEELNNAAADLARRQLEHELLVEVHERFADPRYAESRRKAKAQAALGLYAGLKPHLWHR